MSNINLKYAALVGLLSSLDDNVVTDENYELIKNRNINDVLEQEDIIELIVVPWFQSYTIEAKRKVIQSLELAINNSDFEDVFNQVDFVFDYEITNKKSFLVKIMSTLDKYV
ncbi:hypothetical protein [Pectobacterium wasabiae]|uniref:TerB family tellurite resistance protein n=1 Tax=Pectobacterium wasabiae TaxID=55208 RepID=A0AAW3EBN2_9GAMM|nr:hypothetical protein [Pectobacterium wasabiae]AOR63412.1 hypothetical protein A7983_09085 [Pectobacterium wasabiae CFBP 3304]EJS93967.1 Hypothetical protein Y17_2801 [Pectobacterium wasabiae CFBP 3304]KFW99413.1 hypothetical protein JV38_23130 [Pectobacterium wasabiae]KGA26094.1 hypothetical protein KU73_23125 [Pectobacterium wasabiae]